ncbi:orotate phosphoribosyltransferase [Candidatus Liberibacter asiaticus]|uniref:Orotate phosphoribosyltransferase n=4 Tax=Liberibacter asiaticus TaxID=34021 RepID=C6XGI1_LIBAP|nr:orotate phosphoribosyltransferase [Candidatus Liberibacter asiaticus]AGH17250.1 orotate phosphoribosyltransferase [Candidatus Liberibacter asiaticus str. gxpsy]ACT57484.1 orotate phosphoribosyltransferase [Candidatus Liberibacter asiaticus str. psy62]ALK07544.1 orotate phosphoribosyltransferase [Candidatus Liberibacter asiaticus]ASK53037.1 orotate phosphoribosyltransferase [Candidatus Liberibacter asiaticus]AWL14361.1 orotate phosphoribosyltransferase [Candidatus Liberibacter asiaticus]
MIVNYFPQQNIIAELVAKMLFEIKAVNFSPENPYHLTSGIVSPLYIDCRKLISFVRARSMIMDLTAKTVLRNIGFESIDIIAGGETAGIPFATLLAERLNLPMIYVRKKSKKHGQKSQIEGHLFKGARVLVIEDLVTLGNSMFEFVKVIRDSGGIIQDGIGLFFYDIFPEVPARFRENNIKLHYLATWNDILTIAEKLKIFNHDVLEEVRCFLDNPMQWSKKNGGIGE